MNLMVNGITVHWKLETVLKRRKREKRRKERGKICKNYEKEKCLS